MTDILNKLVPEDKPAVEKVNNEDNKETIWVY
jgi:hypothetical protein